VTPYPGRRKPQPEPVTRRTPLSAPTAAETLSLRSRRGAGRATAARGAGAPCSLARRPPAPRETHDWPTGALGRAEGTPVQPEDHTQILA
jgi:hypothetical protein